MIAQLQLVHPVTFVAPVAPSRFLSAPDYVITREGNDFRAVHRPTGQVRMVPASNVVAWVPGEQAARPDKPKADGRRSPR